MAPPPPHPERGLALLLVLLLSLILLPFAASFTIQVDHEAQTAINVSHQLKIENAIDGWFEVVLARLQYDAGDNETDSFLDSWADPELNQHTEEYTQVGLEAQILDEQGKFCLRMLSDAAPERQALYKQRLIRLLLQFRRDTSLELGISEAEQWAESITQYLKGGPARANIPRPNTVDKRPILVIEELMFLPEVGDHRFDFILYDQREGDNTAPGLHRFATIYGTGQVNLNTAPVEVLYAFFPENAEIAERIIERRDSAPDDDTENPTFVSDEDQQQGNPFEDVQEVLQIEGIEPQELAANNVDLGQDFTVTSQFFSIRISAKTDVTRRDETLFVERVPSTEEDEALEGFRFLLRQERTDILESFDEDA